MNKPILFTTQFCPKCELAKQKLQAMRIDYIESTDVNEAKKYGISDVPYLVYPNNNFRYSLKEIISAEHIGDDNE